MKQFDMGKLSENIDRIAQYDISNNKVFGSAYYVYCDGKTIEKTELEKEKLYEVMKNTWHHLRVSSDALLLVMENSNT